MCRSGDQEDEHSCFSDTTHQDFVYDLKGIADVWSGVMAGGKETSPNDPFSEDSPFDFSNSV